MCDDLVAPNPHFPHQFATDSPVSHADPFSGCPEYDSASASTWRAGELRAMNSKRTQSENVSRLLTLQEEARAHAAKHDWFTEHLRSGFTSYIDLVQSYNAIRNKQEWYARTRARFALAFGLFQDRALQEEDIPYIVRFPRLTPEMGALEAARHKRQNKDTSDFQYPGFEALTALDILEMDLDETVKWSFLSKFQSYEIPIKKSDDWQEPIDPSSLDVAVLTQHPEAHYRLIALFRIGGLIDFANPRPVIARPDNSGDASGLQAHLWENRSPGGARSLSQLEANGVGPDLLTVYTRFWEHLKSSLKRDKTSITTASSVIPPDIDYDKNDMLPAGKFPKMIQSRLRKASQPGRKTKSVRSIRVGNVTLYSSSDAVRNWPEAFTATDDRE